MTRKRNPPASRPRPPATAATVEEVRAMLAGVAGRRGARRDKKDLLRLVWARFSDDEFPFATEYVFDPPRKSRFDFALPAMLLAVEVEGVSFNTKSRHAHAVGYLKDCEKYNRAAVLGWLVVRFTTLDLGDLHGAERAFEVLTMAAAMQGARRAGRAVKVDNVIAGNRANWRAIEQRFRGRGGAWLPPDGLGLDVALAMVRESRFGGRSLE